MQLRTLVMVTALVLGAPDPLAACSCSFPDPQTALKQADLVFRGTIVAVEYLDPPRSVPHIIAEDRMVGVLRRFLATLEVSGVWKGAVGQRIVLHTREGSSDCVGFWTDIGKDVLVFAHRDVVTPKRPDVWRIPEWTDKVALGEVITSPGVCTLTDEIKHAKDTLKKLGRPKPPTANPESK